MRRVIFNRKGGVGKSSIVCNLAAISAAQGVKTLVIDLDPQCNTSQYLLGDGMVHPPINIAQFFEEQLAFLSRGHDPDHFVSGTPYDNLFLIGASPALAELQSRLEAKHKIFKLRDALVKLARKYPAIYIDTPPSFNFYTLSALVAAKRCLIPFDCDEFSRQAVYDLLNDVKEIRTDHNKELEVEGIIVNQFQERARQPRRVVEELQEEGLRVLKTHISSSVKMKESHEAGVPLVHFAPNHKITQQYVALYDEIHTNGKA